MPSGDTKFFPSFSKKKKRVPPTLIIFPGGYLPLKMQGFSEAICLDFLPLGQREQLATQYFQKENHSYVDNTNDPVALGREALSRVWCVPYAIHPLSSVNEAQTSSCWSR